ncbi:glucose-6-phosphate dehydrogenase assembly protein OpcA [Thermostichus vulcanus]|uniref:Glucose-6-phosphate dehydrogenase assembly protein OpcA n=1 Tax=Thermostichus vulcanus str. 'Rupite' TaxID=2813851 RepID=A0ABT0CEZ9_THEVL|nr:glucose-6-phosphate dehydrogenase assembly protein OpcA [Thermostichus vulcanus]MCJ2544350.1 glucose-6-phosphate dehydrogenase assembly protein OpcA [Thermostichus vulcanus str. 'Rupite']
MDQSAAVLPLQAPKDVSIDDIEQELNKIWSSKGESVAARAATFTLVVYESLDDALLLPSPTVEAIATQNPCRVIDLRAKREGSAEDVIESQVAAYCPVTREQRSSLVCCEYITLKAPESAFVRACSTVASLLIPSLPTFLWWQGDLDLNSLLFQKLVSLSNRVIVDSRGFVNPEEDLGEMYLLTTEGRQCGDLNWKRLSSWQELTAQAFDPPDRRESLQAVDRVTLDYKAGNPCQAFLFLGWLASRLGWTPIERVQTKEHDYLIDRIRFQRASGGEVMAELAAVPLASEMTQPGDLIGMRLTSSDIRADACTVLCSETTGCMRMEAMGGAQSCVIRQVAPIEHDSLDTLLTAELQRLGPDHLYEETLVVVDQILKLAF